MSKNDEALRFVLDASASLAYLHEEPGGERVKAELKHSLVLQKSLAYGADTKGLRQELEALGLQILDFDVLQAEVAAELWPVTKQAGLSLADRACLALAQSKILPALTSDGKWTQVFGNVQMIR